MKFLFKASPLMNPLDMIFRLQKARKMRRELNLIRNSRFFDQEYYVKTYPDVEEAKVDPAEHYLIYGGFEGRNPSEHFNTDFYLEQNPDVVKSKINPLLHYIIYGIDEDRKILPDIGKDSFNEEIKKEEDDINLYIDNCIVMPNRIQIVGWALSKNGIKNIDVYLNDAFLGKARVGQNRPDLKKAFPEISSADKGGFNFTKIFLMEKVAQEMKNNILSLKVTDNQNNIRFLDKKVDLINYEEAKLLKTDKIRLSEDIKILTGQESVVQADVTISVVIPTKNAGNDFDNLLRTLMHQKGFNEIELIIVDSGSTDNTVSIAKSHGAKVVEIKPEEFTHSYSRNLGAEQAENDYLFFTVQDAVPSSQYLFYQLYKRLKKSNLQVITCTETPRADCDLFYRVTNRNHYTFLDVINKDKIFTYPGTDDHIQLRKNAQLSDIALFIDRNLFLKYKYRLDYGEDLDLGMRLVKDGYKLYYAGTVKMIHSHNRLPFYYLKRGLVDSLYLKIRFKDFKFPDVKIQDVILEIPALYNLIVSLVEDKLLKIDHFSTFAKIDCSEELESFYDQPLTKTSKLMTSGLVDSQTSDFISHLMSQTEAIGFSENPAKSITGGVINYNYKLNDYVLDYYGELGKESVINYAGALLRIFGLLTGAYLGYSHLNNPEDSYAREIAENLRKNV